MLRLVAEIDGEKIYFSQQTSTYYFHSPTFPCFLSLGEEEFHEFLLSRIAYVEKLPRRQVKNRSHILYV